MRGLHCSAIIATIQKEPAGNRKGAALNALLLVVFATRISWITPGSHARPNLTQFVIPTSKSDSDPRPKSPTKAAWRSDHAPYPLKTIRIRAFPFGGPKPPVLVGKVRSKGQRVDKTELETEKGRKRNAETEGLFTD
jgi:hypothetical protein